MHKQKAQVGAVDVWPTKTPVFRRSWALPNDLKHNGASFLTTLMDLLCLQVAQMPRFRDLVIFVLTTDR